MRFEYPKTDRLAFLGHLELIATIERSVRRAGLPFAVSNGFARRMRIQFSSALPVGVSSKAEYFDLFLTEKLDCEDTLDHLRRFSPAALAPVRACHADPSLPALEAWLNRSSWKLDLGTAADPAVFEQGVQAVLERGSFTYMRGEKEKTVDVGAAYVSHRIEASEQASFLYLETLAQPFGSMRPEAFARACFNASAAPQAAPAYLKCVRLAQYHLDDGALVEPIQQSLPNLVD